MLCASNVDKEIDRLIDWLIDFTNIVAELIRSKSTDVRVEPTDYGVQQHIVQART